MEDDLKELNSKTLREFLKINSKYEWKSNDLEEYKKQIKEIENKKKEFSNLINNNDYEKLSIIQPPLIYGVSQVDDFYIQSNLSKQQQDELTLKQEKIKEINSQKPQQKQVKPLNNNLIGGTAIYAIAFFIVLSIFIAILTVEVSFFSIAFVIVIILVTIFLVLSNIEKYITLFNTIKDNLLVKKYNETQYSIDLNNYIKNNQSLLEEYENDFMSYLDKLKELIIGFMKKLEPEVENLREKLKLDKFQKSLGLYGAFNGYGEEGFERMADALDNGEAKTLMDAAKIYFEERENSRQNDDGNDFFNQIIKEVDSKSIVGNLEEKERQKREEERRERFEMDMHLKQKYQEEEIKKQNKRIQEMEREQRKNSQEFVPNIAKCNVCRNRKTCNRKSCHFRIDHVENIK